MLTPQALSVLRRLKKTTGVTALDALQWCGSFRLAARIHELRNAGHSITTRWRRTTGGSRIAVYVLQKQKSPR